MKTDPKRPQARSPISPLRLRTPRVLQPSNTTTTLSISTATMTKSQTKESQVRPAYQSISCEFTALSKMLQDQLGAMNSIANPSHSTTKLASGLEKGLLYDVYTARRNERLKKKQNESDVDNEPKTVYSLGVKVELSTKKESKKKSTTVNCSVDRSQYPRYALRSRVKKPLAVPIDVAAGARARII